MPKNIEINTFKENIMSLREWIKFCIRLKGETLRSFGQRHGVTAGSVSVVFYRLYPRMEKLIADAFETNPWTIWPERYTDQKPNRFNSWYRRKSGDWKPKIAQKNLESRRKILDGNDDGAN